ncbi:Zinc finger, C6HC-type [Aspergillus oryzae]|uniref:RBR-type E3 ubiquitin transferase n=1 Tax=Aspergillus oryzae TaxID=5062 RepID=A0A1S9D7C0_ASPOZ|nr:Zinc finger, C6HC-type [Aspergillus oryzae]
MAAERVTPPPRADETNTDDEVVALLQQLEEIDLFGGKQKGKGRADKPLGIDLAMTFFRDEVQAHIGFLNDLKLAHSIGHAVFMDGPAIAGVVQESCKPKNPSRGRVSSQSYHLHIPKGHLDGKGDIDRDSDEDKGGPSKTYAERQKDAMERLSRPKLQCCICFERYESSDIIRLECGDLYCTDCLKSLFMRATKDEQLFPPRCCRQYIPLSLITKQMTTEEKDAFQRAKIEFSTSNRTYCSNTVCGRFIIPSNIFSEQAKYDCPEDAALQEMLKLSTSQGWQRCLSCKAMVELTVGCYHMTCNCKAEFCYLCGKKWKTCRCAMWAERRLVARAEEIVDRELDHPLPLQERQHRIAQLRDHLLETHQCDHVERFERIAGDTRARFACEMREAAPEIGLRPCALLSIYENACSDDSPLEEV